MSEYNKKNLKAKLIIILSLIFLTIIGLSFTYSNLTLNPFASIKLYNTSGANIGDNGELYVVSDSNRTINKIKDFSVLEFSIKGGNRKENSFYTVSQIEADKDGNLYVSHNRWDSTGSYLEMETISVFDVNGKFKENIFELPDTTESKLIPNIKGLKYTNETIYWYVLNEKGILLFNSREQGVHKAYPFDAANHLVSDVEYIDDSKWLISTKQGLIIEIDFHLDKETVVFDAVSSSFSDSHNVIGILYEEILYLNDIGIHGIYSYDKNELFPIIKSDMYGEKDLVYYNFDVHNNEAVAVHDEGIVFKNKSNEFIMIDQLRPSLNILILRIIAWLSLVVLVISLILLFRFLAKEIFKGKFPKNAKRTAAIITVILVASVLTSTLAINFYNQILVEQAYNNLKSIVQNSRFMIHGDSVDQIKHSYDFAGEHYNIVYEDLQKMINYNQESWNENLYTALYTIKDGRYYALMYNDNRVTPYYTFNAWTDNENYDFFKNAYMGEIVEGTENDADGDWLFSMGPVYNSNGEIVAIIEVGMNKFIFDEWNKNIVNKIVTDIVSIIIIAVLLISEVSFFTNWLEQKKSLSSESKSSDFNDLNIVRTLALLTYVVIFMCVAFVPIMAKSIYEPIGNLSMSMAIGLPIFAEVFFAAITILFAGFIAEKKGWRTIFYLGISILIVAAVITAFTKSLVVFIFIRGLAGIGNGFIQMTMHAFINTGESISKRNESFANMMSGAIAGINLGVVFGANLADKIGFFNVFFIVAGIGIIALIFQFAYMRKYETKEFHIEEESFEAEITWKQYFSRKNVIAFFTFILIPAFLCYMYLEYFFPLFAERNGISTSVIGIVFSLYGLFIVYFGPSMSTFAEKYFGVKNASVIASMLTGVSLIIFALTGTLIGAIFAVFILAVSDSFGETVYTTYFLALKESQKIGKSIAASYLEFFSQIGKMLGALVFAVAIGFGEQIGIGLIGIITIGFSILFLPIGEKVPKSED